MTTGAPSPRPLLVLAGNNVQFERWRRTLAPPETAAAVYVSRRERLLGRANFDWTTVGTYLDRPDIVELLETIKSRPGSVYIPSGTLEAMALVPERDAP